MSHKYEELRKTYSKFIYEKFDTEIESGVLKVTYFFEVPGLASFRPTLNFDLRHELVVNDALSALGQKILFAIGMVELISYWKIACPPLVEVKAAALDFEQIDWWKRLYFNGLGEFFYKNSIDAHFSDFMDLRSVDRDENIEVKVESNSEVITEYVFQGLNLIPIGGGKDSIVSVEHLSELKDKNVVFGLNPTQASRDSMRIAGYGDKQSYIVQRTLDSEMLRLNAEGFLNGHTPFSALLAFVAYYTAYLIGAENIVLSNEASANAASIAGTEINHQYSKTSEFEIAFQAYSKKYLSDKIYYFSLLRPFAEIAIARSFTKYEKYFPYFRSCNRGSKKNIWCANCSKCLFIFAMISPFLSHERVVEIFGKDLWENEGLLEDWAMLLGVFEQKPFECVGTIEEVQYATVLIVNLFLNQFEMAKIAEYENVNLNETYLSLPLLLRYSVEQVKEGHLAELAWSDSEHRLASLATENPLTKWHVDERLPEKFKKLVQDIIL